MKQELVIKATLLQRAQSRLPWVHLHTKTQAVKCDPPQNHICYNCVRMNQAYKVLLHENCVVKRLYSASSTVQIGLGILGWPTGKKLSTEVLKRSHTKWITFKHCSTYLAGILCHTPCRQSSICSTAKNHHFIIYI